ncbi:unnamed protein product [Vitrella brassicaformis CCMP3155]|uniref:Uncharacterized protein n=1 Tax=Vitrella brassicaformis (strain CCMP3155) TaxID=1169540 RepID=A0A0G4EKX0_VITBC|nr:unnamed protein product [Vitrella brassicaformis CCMP3155]|eukprot:CEL97210.1 unnamed protein product [Vitrella brassicaformis CCMP3155]
MVFDITLGVGLFAIFFQEFARGCGSASSGATMVFPPVDFITFCVQALVCTFWISLSIWMILNILNIGQEDTSRLRLAL